MNPYRRISFNVVDEIAVVTLLDVRIVEESVIRELGDELFHLVEQRKLNAVALCFANVEYLSSAALNKLILLERAVKRAAGRVVAFGLKKEIAETFTLTRVEKLIAVLPDQQVALAEFANKTT